MDFLAVIPYLLGFHPSESLVTVLSSGGRVVLTARLDLPAPGSAAPVAAQVRQLASEHRIDEVVLVAYSEAETPGRQLLERVRTGLAGTVAVREVLLVSGARWWSLSCSTGCCPTEGARFDPEAHPLAAEAVWAGLSAGRSRAALEELVAGPAAEALPRLRGLLAGAREALAGTDRPAAAEAMAAAVRAAVGDPEVPDEAGCARLAVLAEDLAVRDVAWAMMSRPVVEQHQRLWCRVVAAAPPEVASGPLGLLGVAAWIGGNGALLNCCVERLEQIDPGYTLGQLLADISERALPPSAWGDLEGDLRQEVAAVTGLPGLH
nr:DUF4192 domain-containing protein [uncultured Friedmanniella sp.]